MDTILLALALAAAKRKFRDETSLWDRMKPEPRP